MKQLTSFALAVLPVVIGVIVAIIVIGKGDEYDVPGLKKAYEYL